MKFEALYFGDRLTIVNPRGGIGVVTLWSKPEYVLEFFRGRLVGSPQRPLPSDPRLQTEALNPLGVVQQCIVSLDADVIYDPGDSLSGRQIPAKEATQAV